MTSQVDIELDLDLDLDDEEVSEAVLTALLKRFGEWMEAGDRPGAEWPVAAMLRFKADYLDGRLGCWRCADLDEILTELFPRKVTADEAGVAEAVPTLRYFFSWMDQTGLLDPGSDAVADLQQTLDRIEPGLPALMLDESRYGLGKTVIAGMLADGLDLDDPDAVQAWVEATSRSLREPPASLSSLPPAALPNDEVLAELAAAAPALAHLQALLAWVGDGRRLTAAQRLPLREAKALGRALDDDALDGLAASAQRRARVTAAEFLFEWGLEAGVVAIDDDVAAPGPCAPAIAGDPLLAWHDVLVGLLHVGVATSDPRTLLVPTCVARLNLAGPALLVELHAHGPLPLADLADLANHGHDVDDDEESHRPSSSGVAARDDAPLCVRLLVGRLEQLHAVETAGGEVRLATLGRWFVRQLADRANLAMPAAPDLSDADPATLLAACEVGEAGTFDDDAATIEGWIASRGAAMAAEQLATLAVRTDDPAVRARAFAALGRVGPAAEPAVRRLEAEPACHAGASRWLAEHGLEEPTDLEEPAELDPAAAPDDLVAQLAGLLARSGSRRMVEQLTTAVPAGEQARVVEGLWRVEHSSVPAVLDAVAAHAPKPAAKAARTARFKRRSAAGAR